MTQLRKLMLEELQRRNYSQTTVTSYIKTVADFAKYVQRPPDQLGSDEIRQYQAIGLRLFVSFRVLYLPQPSEKSCHLVPFSRRYLAPDANAVLRKASMRSLVSFGLSCCTQ